MHRTSTDLRSGVHAPPHAPAPMAPPLSPVEQGRADCYGLAARLLSAPADAALLQALASMQDPHPAGSVLADAWRSLREAARAPAREVAEAFDALFVSIGTPRLNPYASVYRSGFMMDQPLADLRADLRALGLARARHVGEPEDHLATLCATMRVLITGVGPVPARPLERQRQFFDRHVAPWYAECLNDMEHAPDAGFYAAAARFVRAFLDIETEAFEMLEGSGWRHESLPSDPLSAAGEGP
ncbi:MAG: molecular chaperone TorD family protein [Pseudomonadota bacterium]